MNCSKKYKSMFKYGSQITTLIKEEADDLAAKRKLIAKANGPLFYAFGNKLVSKPWLTYLEQQ